MDYTPGHETQQLLGMEEEALSKPILQHILSLSLSPTLRVWRCGALQMSSVSPSMTRQTTASNGAATLYIEVFSVFEAMLATLSLLPSMTRKIFWASESVPTSIQEHWSGNFARTVQNEVEIEVFWESGTERKLC